MGHRDCPWCGDWHGAKHGLLTLLCQTVKSVIYKSLLQVITTKKASAAFIILHPLSISNLYPSPNPFLIFVPNCGKHTFPNNWKYRDCSALFFKGTSKQKYKMYVLFAFLQLLVKLSVFLLINFMHFLKSKSICL